MDYKAVTDGLYAYAKGLQWKICHKEIGKSTVLSI
jgi:hypothetical protein